MQMQNTHYRHSGKAPFGGILLTFIGGLIAGVVLGGVYGLLIYWIPFIYINVFVTIGFGIALAVAVGTLGQLGKVRNNTAVTVVALFVSIVAYYAHWVVWTEAIADTYILAPSELWQMLSTIAVLGPWSVFGWTPTGWAMWSIWGLEAAMIVGIGTVSAHGVIAVPFCESTNQWTTESTLPTQFKALDSNQSLDSPLALLRALQPLDEESSEYTEISVAEADGSDLRCVTLKAVTVETKDDKEELTTADIVKNMLFDRSSFDKLKGVGNA